MKQIQSFSIAAKCCTLLITLSFAACNNEEQITAPDTPQKVAMTFFAGTDMDTAATRATLQSNYDVFWDQGDNISILYMDQSEQTLENAMFTLASGQGTCKATFTGTAVKGTTYAGVYPYSANHNVGFIGKLSDRTLCVNGATIPILQTAQAGTFDHDAALQLAYTTTDTLAFYNVTSLLRITPQFDCSSIVIETTDTAGSTPTTSLTGGMQLSWNKDKPYFPVATPYDSKGCSQVVLRGTIEKGKTYYVAVCPMTTTSQLRVTFRNGDKAVSYLKGKTTGITLNRGKIKNIPTTGDTAPTTSELVDLGLSVKWSSQNLGASSATETGTLYAWGEKGPKQAYTSTNYLYKGTTSPLPASDDIASLLSNSALRMPTQTEIQELISNCTWTFVQNYNSTGIRGFVVTSNKTGYTDKSIFLPMYGTSVGYFWSSDATSSTANALIIGADLSLESPTTYYRLDTPDKYKGYAIRPVGK